MSTATKVKDKNTEDKSKAENIKRPIISEDRKKVKFDDWEKFTSYCIKCGKRKKIHKGRCDIDVYHLRNKNFIPICSECFAKLPEIPDGYLDDATVVPDKKDTVIQEVITYIFKCKQNKTLGLDKNFTNLDCYHAG